MKKLLILGVNGFIGHHLSEAVIRETDWDVYGMDLAAGSYFGARRPKDGRIELDWPGMRVHAMIRAVAPPFPGAFLDAAGHRVVFASSRISAQGAAHPDLAPCLYATAGELFMDCQDGVRLSIGSVLIDGAAVGGPEFQERFGTQPWRFNFTAQDQGT